MRVIDLHKELNALGIPFEPIGWVKAPVYPYGVYSDQIDVRQPDTSADRRVIRHAVEIEVFHPNLDKLNESAKALRAWINSIPLNYTMRTTLIVDEDHYSTRFAFSYSNTERD